MRKILLYLWGIFLLINLAACHPSRLKPKSYVKWIEDSRHGLKMKKKIGDFIFEIQYKPVGYIALKEASAENNITGNNIEKKEKELSGMYYFTFQINSADEKTPMLKYKLKQHDEFYGRVNYFVSYAQEDFILLSGKDTLNCVLYHFEENYNLTSFNRIVLAFDKNDGNTEKNDLVLIFKDRVLNIGEVRFLFHKSKLNNIPELKI